MFTDLSPLIQSPLDWCVLFVSALLIGMSKTGIQGISMLAIPFMALTFGAKPSTGIILPMLCFSDLMAVFYYRRAAEWKYIIKLLPAAIAGFGLALLVDKFIPPAEFKHLLAACLLFVIGIMFWDARQKDGGKWTEKWWYGPSFGLLGGFTTMIGNAAGPVMAIFLLSVKLPKYSFVGTSAWFFMVVNYLKVPLQVFAWHNINYQTLMLNAYCIPFMIVGGLAGIYVVKKLPEKGFREFTTVLTVISVLLLLF